MAKNIWLIAGLGNPGKKYEKNRHNIGFMFLDSWRGEALSAWSSQSGAEIRKSQLGDNSLILVKPQDYMNRSGEAVSRLASFYKIPANNIIIIHDEVELPFGKMRLKQGGGNAGHNGLKSISTLLGTDNYFRLRLGVGRPQHPDFDLADWVLSNFSSEENRQMDEFFSRAEACLQTLIESGLAPAQARYNS